jgi:hypothetical protein
MIPSTSIIKTGAFSWVWPPIPGIREKRSERTINNALYFFKIETSSVSLLRYLKKQGMSNDDETLGKFLRNIREIHTLILSRSSAMRTSPE